MHQTEDASYNQCCQWITVSPCQHIQTVHRRMKSFRFVTMFLRYNVTWEDWNAEPPFTNLAKVRTCGSGWIQICFSMMHSNSLMAKIHKWITHYLIFPFNQPSEWSVWNLFSSCLSCSQGLYEQSDGLRMINESRTRSRRSEERENYQWACCSHECQSGDCNTNWMSHSCPELRMSVQKHTWCAYIDNVWSPLCKALDVCRLNRPMWYAYMSVFACWCRSCEYRSGLIWEWALRL